MRSAVETLVFAFILVSWAYLPFAVILLFRWLK